MQEKIRNYIIQEYQNNNIEFVLLGGDDEATEESESLKAALKADKSITPLVAFSMLVFILMYIPCMAVFAVVKAESSWKWAFFMSFYTTAIAWIASFIVYQGGSLIFGL